MLETRRTSEGVVKRSTGRSGGPLRTLLAAGIASAIVGGASLHPALAHDDCDGDGWRHHEWREHELREREWRWHHRPYVYGYPGYYQSAPVIVVPSPPPSVIYSPPPQGARRCLVHPATNFGRYHVTPARLPTKWTNVAAARWGGSVVTPDISSNAPTSKASTAPSR
jgi:hypothetical protein